MLAKDTLSAQSHMYVHTYIYVVYTYIYICTAKNHLRHTRTTIQVARVQILFQICFSSRRLQNRPVLNSICVFVSKYICVCHLRVLLLDSLLFCIFAFDYTCVCHLCVSLHLCVSDGHSCVLTTITRVCMGWLRLVGSLKL